MAFFILGLLLGGGLGAWFTHRWHQAQADRAPVTDAGPATTSPMVATDLPAAPPISKKAAKLGISADAFRPSDDILQRMQRAWDLGISLEELDEREAAEREARDLVARIGSTPSVGEHDPVPPSPPAPASPSTVTEAVEQLAREGYTDDLHLQGGELGCPACGTEHPTDLVVVDRVYRFEGPSDPADEAIVLGLRCPACGARGSLVSAFGPDADPDLARAFTYLASRAQHG